MRVLVVTSHCDRSETCLYQRLRRLGTELEVVCHPRAVRLKELEESAVPVYPLQFRSRLDLRAVRAIRQRLIEGAFDMAHAFNKRALTHVMLASRGLPVRILTYRGVIGNLHRWNPEVRWTFYNSRLAGIVAVCNAVRQYLLDIGIPAQAVRTIYKGHDPAWYKPAQRADLQGLGIPDGAFVIGCAGHMRARKGLLTLVDAVSLLPKGSVHLLLAGVISDRQVLPRANALGLKEVVHTPGFRADAPALMGACDLFVMPSLRREGLPRAVIEAMAQGVPAIVTRVGGMPEIVQHEKNGWVVEPGDAVAMAAAIRSAFDDGRRRVCGEQARERIRNAFHIDDTVEQTLRFYREIFARKRSA